MSKKDYPINKSDAAWKAQLTDEEYRVLREKGTEYPFTGKYNDHREKGVYTCKGCGQELYQSKNKFDSGCGWPSYDKSVDGSIEYVKDVSHGMIRTEIVCSNCGGHQGHVFDDGPTESGKRYCVNAASIDFIPEKK